MKQVIAMLHVQERTNSSAIGLQIGLKILSRAADDAEKGDRV